MDGDARTVLVELVRSEGEAFYGDPTRVESRLRERVPGRPAEVTVLVTAMRAGAVDELLAVKPGLVEIAVGHLAGRMVRIFDADPEVAHWAVETWAEALRVGPPRSGDVRSPYRAPERHQNERVERPAARRVAIPWPWVAAVGAGIVALVALVVLVRMIVGLVHSGGGGETKPAAAPTSTTSTAPPTTAPAQAGVLTVPPGLRLGTGDVQVTLLWADGNDLDLHVVDPSGAEIYFSHPNSPTGGTLDHDDTAGCSSTGTHVENVFWPAGGAPPGSYRVFVKNYSSCGAPSRYTLRANAKGRVAISSSGTVGAHEGDQTPVSEFSFS